jgi:hypothetical protein
MLFNVWEKRVSMKLEIRAFLTGVLACLTLSLAGPAARADSRLDVSPAGGPKWNDGNLDRVRRFLAETSAPGHGLDDYYFVLIGDVQNNVLSYSHAVFNAIAKDLYAAADEKTGERFYDKVRFVILLGDLVYEGPSHRQWEWFEKALAGQGPDRTPYPFLEILAREKPIFPAIGNHELLSFRFYTQNRYKDLFDSPRGVDRFKSFFDWDRWIADPSVLYPVPADLSSEAFRQAASRLADPADRQSLSEQYLLHSDGRYHLKFYDHPPLQEAEFRAAKERLAGALAPIFRKAGYGTLPVLNSDNMIHYAFEAGNVVYLLLDSLARGWQYPGFARLKQALYPAKRDQHRLNLMSLSPFNGQADFYEAVAAYARERGKTLVPMMHSPTFNSSRSVYLTGLGYNSWLALGFPLPGQQDSNPTIFDELLFSDIPYSFCACVHAFEHFTIVSKDPGKPDHALQWYISGGGGGPPRKDFSPGKVKEFETLYNQKMSKAGGTEAGRSIKITDDVTGVGHHYLLVHVAGGRIVEVTPHFIDPKVRNLPISRPQVALTSFYSSRPGSAGAAIEFSPGFGNVGKVIKYLGFINWVPSVSLGFVDYNVWKKSPDVRAYAATLDVSPLNLECHIPNGNIMTLRLLGLEYWNGRANLRRAFVTMGLEMPLVYNLTGHLENLNFGLKVRFPLAAGVSTDPLFGARTKLSFFVGYRIKL